MSSLLLTAAFAGALGVSSSEIRADALIPSGTPCRPVEILGENPTLYHVGNLTGFAVYHRGALVDLGFGDPDIPDDIFIFLKLGVDPGSYDLGSGVNSSRLTCEQCIEVFQDWPEDATTPEKIMFQANGVITYTGAPGTEATQISLAGVTLVEYESNKPVPGGECYSDVTNVIFANDFETPSN